MNNKYVNNKLNKYTFKMEKDKGIVIYLNRSDNPNDIEIVHLDKDKIIFKYNTRGEWGWITNQLCLI